jgi:Protein of unknown function (DUF3110)
MTRAEALAFLQLTPTASEHEIRSALFYAYDQLMQSQSTGDATWAEQLMQLNHIREVVMAQDETSFRSAADSHRLSSAELPPHLYVLLYSEDHEETIHTLQAGGQDWVLAFVNAFTARRYIQRIALAPWVERFASPQILEFCANAGYGILVVPQDQVVPPY